MAQLTVSDFIREWRSEVDTVKAHTSGSTGRPKEIQLPKTLMRRSARRTNLFFGIDAKARLHLCLSPDYIAGKMMIIRALEAGCELTCEEAGNNPLSQDGSQRRITLLAVVPSQLAELLDNPQRLRLVDNILVGGSAIPPGMRGRLAKLPIPVWESYGMTETASHVALRRVTEDAMLPFRIMPGITCSLADNGTLCIEGNGRCLTTTDCAEVLTPTTFRLLGRLDHAIISGGIKIHPLQAEAEAADILAPYQPCFITSVPDEKWGEKVVLAVLRAVPESLLHGLRARLGSVRAPKEIRVIDRIPLSPSGKPLRPKLPK